MAIRWGGGVDLGHGAEEGASLAGPGDDAGGEEEPDRSGHPRPAQQAHPGDQGGQPAEFEAARVGSEAEPLGEGTAASG